MCKIRNLPKKLYTSACCIWDYDTDEMLAGPDYMGFSSNTLNHYGNYDVYHYEYDIRENSDGELEKYFDVYVKEGKVVTECSN